MHLLKTQGELRVTFTCIAEEESLYSPPPHSHNILLSFGKSTKNTHSMCRIVLKKGGNCAILEYDLQHVSASFLRKEAKCQEKCE